MSRPIAVSPNPNDRNFGALSIRDRSTPVQIKGSSSAESDDVSWASVESYLLWMSMVIPDGHQSTMSNTRSVARMLFEIDQNKEYRKKGGKYDAKFAEFQEVQQLMKLRIDSAEDAIENYNSELLDDEQDNTQSVRDKLRATTEERDDLVAKYKEQASNEVPSSLSKREIKKRWKELLQDRSRIDERNKYELPMHILANELSARSQRERVKKWALAGYTSLAAEEGLRHALLSTGTNDLTYVDPYALPHQPSFYGVSPGTTREVYNADPIAAALEEIRKVLRDVDDSRRVATAKIEWYRELGSIWIAKGYLENLIKTQDIKEFLGKSVSEIIDDYQDRTFEVLVKKGPHTGLSFRLHALPEEEQDVNSERVKTALKARGVKTELGPSSIALTRVDHPSLPIVTDEFLKTVMNLGQFSRIVFAVREKPRSLAQIIRKEGIRDLYQYRLNVEKREVLKWYLCWVLDQWQKKDGANREDETPQAKNEIVNRALAKAFSNPECMQKLVDHVNKLYNYSEVIDGVSSCAMNNIEGASSPEETETLTGYIDDKMKKFCFSLGPGPAWCDVIAVSSVDAEISSEYPCTPCQKAIGDTSSLQAETDRRAAASLEEERGENALMKLRKDLSTEGVVISTALVASLRSAPPCGVQSAMQIAQVIAQNWLTDAVRKNSKHSGLTRTHMAQLLTAAEQGDPLDPFLSNKAGNEESREALRNQLSQKKGLTLLLNEPLVTQGGALSPAVSEEEGVSGVEISVPLPRGAIKLCSGISGSKRCKSVPGNVVEDTKLKVLVPTHYLSRGAMVNIDNTVGAASFPTLMHSFFLRWFLLMGESDDLAFYRLLSWQVKNYVASAILVRSPSVDGKGLLEKPPKTMVPILMRAMEEQPGKKVEEVVVEGYTTRKLNRDGGAQFIEGLLRNIGVTDQEGSASLQAVTQWRDLLRGIVAIPGDRFVESVAPTDGDIPDGMSKQYQLAVSAYKKKKYMMGLRTAHLIKFGLNEKASTSSINQLARSQLLSTLNAFPTLQQSQYAAANGQPDILYLNKNKSLGAGSDSLSGISSPMRGANLVGKSLVEMRKLLVSKMDNPDVARAILTEIQVPQHIGARLENLAGPGKDSFMSILCRHPFVNEPPMNRMRVLTALVMYITHRMTPPAILPKLYTTEKHSLARTIEGLVTGLPLNLKGAASSTVNYENYAKAALRDYSQSLYSVFLRKHDVHAKNEILAKRDGEPSVETESLDTEGFLPPGDNVNEGTPGVRDLQKSLTNLLVCVLRLGPDLRQESAEVGDTELLSELVLEAIITGGRGSLLLGSPYPA